MKSQKKLIERKVRFHIRLTDEEHTIVQTAAEIERLSTGTFGALHVINAAERVIKDYKEE